MFLVGMLCLNAQTRAMAGAGGRSFGHGDSAEEGWDAAGAPGREQEAAPLPTPSPPPTPACLDGRPARDKDSELSPFKSRKAPIEGISASETNVGLGIQWVY